MRVAGQGAYVGTFDDTGAADKGVLAVTSGLNQRQSKLTLIFNSNATNTRYVLMNICELLWSH